MDLRQEPTLTDVAQLLDTIRAGADGGYPATLHVLRWLIESSPAAREIYDRLYARRDREPSLIELARLMLAVEDGEPYPSALYTVNWLIGRSKQAGELYRRLEQLGRDAGVDVGFRGWAGQALEINGELDRLLETLDEWRDAAAEIRLEMQKDDAFEHLLLTCRARIARSDGEERERLERLRRRLQDGAERIRRISGSEKRLSEHQSALRSLDDPAAALAIVEDLAGRRRSQ